MTDEQQDIHYDHQLPRPTPAQYIEVVHTAEGIVNQHTICDVRMVQLALAFLMLHDDYKPFLPAPTPSTDGDSVSMKGKNVDRDWPDPIDDPEQSKSIGLLLHGFHRAILVNERNQNVGHDRYCDAVQRYDEAIKARVTATVEEAVRKERERLATELEAIAEKFEEAHRREYCAGRHNSELQSKGSAYIGAAGVVRNSHLAPSRPAGAET